MTIGADVKHPSYGAIRLYGKDFQTASDPFRDADGMAVLVTTKADPIIRILRLPGTMLPSARKARTPPAKVLDNRSIRARGE